MSEYLPVLYVALAVVFLLVAIIRMSLHPFLALLLSAMLLGLLTGQGMVNTLDVILDGFAHTLRWIGLVMVLGTLIGEILHVTGASYRIADTVLRAVGRKRVPVTMGVTGYIVAIPVFADVAYIMLLPIVESLARQSKTRILVVGLSLAAGLGATHALLPPTPGPLAGAGILGADLGRSILINIFVAFFATTGGILWAVWRCGRESLPFDSQMEESSSSEASLQSHLATAPSAWGSFTPILVPLALIAAGSFLEPESQDTWAQFMQFLGHPVVALLVGVSLASLALKAGGRMVRLQSLLESSITKSAVVIMITGAGGAFGAVIKAADIGPAVANVVEQVGFPSLLLPFLLAAALTTSTGSMTVSMVTTSSLMAPLLADFGISPEICLALIGSGSFCVIHANASFFWLMAKLHDVPPQTLYRTYTMQSLCMGICGLVGVLILWGIGIR